MYNINVIHPEGYPHSQAFDEVSELLLHAFTALGLPCTLSRNKIDTGRRNIVIGSHLLPHGAPVDFPRSTIILNTEQLFSSQNAQWSKLITDLARTYFVWDYNERNIESLAAQGITNIALLKIGYQPELGRIPKPALQDIDVLFYGSLNDRRLSVIEQLRADGLNVKTLFGVYAGERDAEIARSKVILNMHYYDQHIFEVVRVFYLMSNSKAVVAEVGPGTFVEDRFLSGLAAAPFEKLAETCKRLVSDSNEREMLERRALNSIRVWPQADFLRQTLSLMDRNSSPETLPTWDTRYRTPLRSSLCPCGSGKRYKKCHGVGV
jgi:hypothetical protein